MPEYQVRVVETIEYTMTVKARSVKQAEAKAEKVFLSTDDIFSAFDGFITERDFSVLEDD